MSELTQKRECSLECLKFLATVLIVFHHYQQNFAGDYTPVKYYNGDFYFGNLVELFFILSGFVSLHLTHGITAKTDGVGFSEYIGKRVCRFIPLMAITAAADQFFRLVYQLILGQRWGEGLSLWGFIISAFGLQAGGAFASQGVNNPTWYLCCL